MNKALYVTDDEEFIIFPHNISSRKEYLEKFSGRLFCPTPGCNAQLDYVELPYYGHEKIVAFGWNCHTLQSDWHLFMLSIIVRIGKIVSFYAYNF